MSYSVIHTKCGQCKKYEGCADHLIIRNAVQGLIHQMPYNTVHKGSGTITHDCTYGGFEPKEDKSKT